MSTARMILPASMHRNWNVIEPSLLAVSGAAGGTLALLLAPEASTPTEYGALFIGFLIFLGMGVLGIAGFTATYIVKAVIKAAAEIAGENAHKLSGLHTQAQFDSRFNRIEEDSQERSQEVVRALGTINDTISGLKHTTELLNQKLDQQISRGDELREGMKDDIEALQKAAFRRNQES